MGVANQKEIIFTTVATYNYLSRAMVMANSVKKRMPNCKVIVCLVEENISGAVKNLHSFFDEIILAKNIGFSNFYRFIFQYNRFEGANACKAQLLLFLLRNYQNNDFFIFLDSDTKVFGPFAELMENFQTSEIILSPHFILFDEKDPVYQMGVIHNSGIFNSGLFAIKRGNGSERFLHWWSDILLKHCHKDYIKGMWNEQKWLDLAPGLFDFQIHKDPGYNVGPWNFSERHLTMDEDGKCLVNGKPLRLFHFSGIRDKYFKERLEKAEPCQKKIINHYRKEYLKELVKVDRDLKAKSWSYGFFSDGGLIHHGSRLIFINNSRLFRQVANPFLKNNHFFKLSLEKHKLEGRKTKKR